MSTFRAVKTLGQISGWTLSNLALQKLLYLAHMTCLGECGRPLVSEPFEAWDLGPVLPTLYHKAKAYGDKPVPDIFAGFAYPKDSPEYESIRGVYDQLKSASPGKLVAITHHDDGAWAKVYEPGIKGIKIPDGEVLDEYRRIVASQADSRRASAAGA